MSDQNCETQTFYAYAKINLSLEILGKRPDGFHEIASVMQTVGLYDTIQITQADDLEFDCNQPELVNEDNLVWKAALQLLELGDEGQQRGANIYLNKVVPMAAGLGGGSSDGAATLVALNQFWKLNLPEEKLVELSAELGSDVPFFVRGGTALSEGRGEILTTLPALPQAWLVLLYPPLPMPASKTKELYRMLSRDDFTNGGVTRALVNTIRRGEPLPQSLIFNGFERAVYERFPQLDYFRQAMVEAGADHVRVSGSGPTLYTILSDEAEAQAITQRLTEGNFFAYAVPTVQP
jgi:4-diphosphocytidyl-2-C-methyl-D-erythritol kinase